MRIIDRVKNTNPVMLVIYAILLGFAIWVLWAVVYRLFYQGQDLAKAKGNAIVATENGKAEGNIADATMNAVAERDHGRDEIRVVVQEGRSKVNDAWKGETVGDDVDRAGADALCKLRPDRLCRGSGTPAVQPIR